jgi:hypothetical protein
MAAGLSRHWALEIVVLPTVGFGKWDSSCWDNARTAHGSVGGARNSISRRDVCMQSANSSPLLSKALPNGPLGGSLGPEEYPSPYFYNPER